MNVLITGGAGFVGSNLANYYSNKGHEVTVFDNLSRKNVEKNLNWLQKSHNSIKFIKGDVRDFNSVKNACKDKDIIFHLAAQVAVTTSVNEPKEDFDINALGTFNVLETARKCNNDPIIVYTSTNKVYGNKVNEVAITEKETRYEFDDKKFKDGIPENFPTDADEHTPYGCSKYVGDLYMRDFHKIFGLKTVTFRMSCIYGPRQFGNEDQGWVAHFIISSFFNKPLTIYGDGKQVRDILFVDDLVNAFESACNNVKKTKGKAYNIGGGVNNTISIKELLTFLKKINLNPKFTFDDWRPGDQKVYISDIRNAENFGWKPSISTFIGIKKLFEWVQENKELF
jgi:CDP-paratose 2-epimerase